MCNCVLSLRKRRCSLPFWFPPEPQPVQKAVVSRVACVVVPTVIESYSSPCDVLPTPEMYENQVIPVDVPPVTPFVTTGPNTGRLPERLLNPAVQLATSVTAHGEAALSVAAARATFPNELLNVTYR